MKNLALAILIPMVLTACTSATNQQLNSPIQANSDIALTAQQPYKGLKRVVAIGRFSDESKRNSSIFVDENNNRLGKQASDVLSSRLTESGKFVLLERPDLAIIKQEAQDTSPVGAKYLLVGSVTEFGRETKSEVGIFSRNLIQQARATVSVRLIDVATSEVVYSEEATGTSSAEANTVFGVGERAAFNTALDDKAVSAAISKLVTNIMNNLMDTPWQTYLVSQEGEQYILAGGANQGLKPGTELVVYLPGKTVTNPQTGKPLELPGKNVAKLTVNSSAGTGDNEVSFASVISGQIDNSNIAKYRILEL